MSPLTELNVKKGIIQDEWRTGDGYEDWNQQNHKWRAAYQPTYIHSLAPRKRRQGGHGHRAYLSVGLISG